MKLLLQVCAYTNMYDFDGVRAAKERLVVVKFWRIKSL